VKSFPITTVTGAIPEPPDTDTLPNTEQVSHTFGQADVVGRADHDERLGAEPAGQELADPRHPVAVQHDDRDGLLRRPLNAATSARET
jgi:hypothetical protein